MDRYILSYYAEADYRLYGDHAIVRQILETNDIEVAVQQFLQIVASIRCLPVASLVVHNIECIVLTEKTDNKGMPIDQHEEER